MKSFLLVAILVVISKAEDDVLSSKVVRSEGSNPYADVGQCRDGILAVKAKNFNSLDEIANSGNYNFHYVTEDDYCGSTEIHGDYKDGYKRTATRTDKANGTPTKLTYTVKLTSPSVISETFNGVDKNGKAFTNTYTLIVLYWDKDLGVFEYVRCSDKGTSTTDSRSIVVRDCFATPDSPGIVTANTLYQIDHVFGLKGSLKPISICPSSMAVTSSILVPGPCICPKH